MKVFFPVSSILFTSLFMFGLEIISAIITCKCRNKLKNNRTIIQSVDRAAYKAIATFVGIFVLNYRQPFSIQTEILDFDHVPT